MSTDQLTSTEGGDSPLIPHCEVCGAALPWDGMLNPSFPMNPCPHCKRRVDYATGKQVPLIDFLAMGRSYGACADARRWTAADCLHFMTMVPEPGEAQMADVLRSLSISPYYRALITFATLYGHRELRDAEMESVLTAGDAETAGKLYELLRDAALHLYHRTHHTTFMGFTGWLSKEAGVPAEELVGELPELMSDDDLCTPKELEEADEMSIQGMSICITGDLDAPREDYAARIRAAGGTCVSGVSRKTNYLVVGPMHGVSKIEKARKYGVKIVQPETLYAALAKEEFETENNTEDVLAEEPEMEIYGKAICITGELDAPPSEYKARIRQARGVCVSGVTRDTDYLVVGLNPEPRKVANAQKYGVKVVTPEILNDALSRAATGEYDVFYDE